MAYLDDHPPARRQFYCPRRDGTQPSGVVVVHTAENTPDFVAFDGGAEAVARFIATRDTPGSYHDLCDSDSIINVVRYECEAFHDATGSNRHSYGVSGATRADVWPLTPAEWRNNCVLNMARAASNFAHWLHDNYGILIPARRIDRPQSDNRIPGFISHAERDPARRTDPGAQFPWGDFLSHFHALTADLRGQGPEPSPVPEEDDMRVITNKGQSLLHLGNGTTIGMTATDRKNYVDSGVDETVVSDDGWTRWKRLPRAD